MFEDRYKLHQIFISAINETDTHGWKLALYIGQSDLSRYKCCRLNKRFATQAEAISRARELARQWIDAGKPEQFPEA
jgi:hypothetical protein